MHHKPPLVMCIILAGIYLADALNSTCAQYSLCPSDVNEIWNKTTTTALQLSAKLCSQTCPLPRETIHTNDDCFDASCFPCDCERPRCEIYGTCCPEALKDQQEQNASMLDAQRKKLTCTSSLNKDVLSIRSCPSNYNNDLLRNLCETDTFDLSKIVVTNARASDNTTGVVYFNVYCAVCNNVFKYEIWDFSIYCNHYLHVYKATTEWDLYKLSLQPNSDCKQVDVPVVGHFPSCRSLWYTRPIDSCNLTGKWMHYDSDVEYYCLNKLYYFHTMISVGELTFKNIFCAICNLDGPPRKTCNLEYREESSNYYQRPLLRSVRYTIPTDKEIDTRFLDCITGDASEFKCLTIQCAEGKIYSDNTCVTPMSIINGLGYRLQLVFEFHKLKILNKNSFLNYRDNVLKNLQDWLDFTVSLSVIAIESISSFTYAQSLEKIMECCLIYEIVNCTMNGNNNSQTYFKCVLTFSLYYFNVYFIADPRHKRDEIENSLTDLIFTRGEIEIRLGENVLKLKYVLGNIIDEDMGLCVKSDMFCQSTGQLFKPRTLSYPVMWTLKDRFLALTPVLTCAHVSYNQSYFKVETTDTEMPWGKQITLSLGEKTLQFKNHTELARLAIDNNNTLKICVDLLRDKINQLQKDPVKSTCTSLLYKHLLSSLCLWVSLVVHYDWSRLCCGTRQ